MPFRYHLYQTDYYLKHDVMYLGYCARCGDEIYVPHDDDHATYIDEDIDELRTYVCTELPSRSIYKYMTKGNRIFDYDPDRDDGFEQLAWCGRTDLIKIAAIDHFSEFGNVDSFLACEVIRYYRREIIDWLKYIGARFERYVFDVIPHPNIGDAEIFMKFSDYTAEELLRDHISELRPSAIRYLADLCIDIDQKAYKSVIKDWSPDKIRILKWIGFPITGEIIQFAKKWGRHIDLSDVWTDKSHPQKIAEIMGYDGGPYGEDEVPDRE